jgi:glycosyltransferase involved in cell wall biosynthesis
LAPDSSTGALQGVKVVHFGHFDPEYARNRVMAKALRRAGAELVTVTDQRPYRRRTPRLARDLVRSPCDVVLVGFPGHADVPLARLVATRRRAPVLFDAFVSLLETAEDRAGSHMTRTQAARYGAEDRLACRLATTVVLDTAAHMDHFGAALGVPSRKMRRVWVGADDDVMHPTPQPIADDFRVFVCASFIPLHGLEHVIRAAYLLEQTGEAARVDIVGSGATEASVRRLVAQLGVRNVAFHGRRPYHELPELIATSHVCLGIFGTSPKASRVVPNKVFDALASARPVITGDTPAAREALTHGHDAWLCPPGDPVALADALRKLASKPELRKRLAAHGYELFRERFSIAAVSDSVSGIVLEQLHTGGSDRADRTRA